MKQAFAKSLTMAILCVGFAGVLALGGCASGSNSAASSSAESSSASAESSAASSAASESASTSAASSAASAETASASSAAAETSSAAASSAAEESASQRSYDETDCMLIALEDAGVGVNSCMITETNIQKSNGMTLYSIDFYTDDMEYEYAINMDTGEIFAADAEPRENANTSGNGNGAAMSADEARAIVYKAAGVDPAEVTVIEEAFTNSYGKDLFTIEFETATMEYEYALDIATGEIFAADSEPK